ncbi:MAG: SCO family protein [Planctomycetota bacterium]
MLPTRPHNPKNCSTQTHRWLGGSVRKVLCGLALLVGTAAAPAFGQSRVGPSPLGNAATPLPPEAQAIYEDPVEQKIGNLLPLDAKFVDQNGQPVTLGNYFFKDKPVLIEFAYFDCPLLCPLVISGMIKATQEVNGVTFDEVGQPINPDAEGDWVPGESFTILTISINPDDNPVSAKRQQDQVLARFQAGVNTDAQGETPLAAGARDGWHFLTGREIDIQRVADAAGFKYAAIPQTNDFTHAPVLVFASPEASITRYLPGHVFPQRDFRLALGESAQGKQGSIFDVLLQICYRYDDSANAFIINPLTLMKAGGAFTLVLVIAVISSLLYFEKKRNRRLSEAEALAAG